MRFLHLCGFGLLFDGCLNVAYLLVQPTNMGFERTLDHRVRTMLQVIFISLWSLTRCSRRLISPLIAPALPIEDARPLGLSSLPVFTDPLGVYPVCFGEIPLALGKGSNALGIGEMDREPSLAHGQHSIPFIATAGFTDHRTDWIP